MSAKKELAFLDLSPAECRTVFALAFGYAPSEDMNAVSLYTKPFNKIGFGDDIHYLLLSEDGSMQASKLVDDVPTPVMFNARKVAAYLDSIRLKMC